jgi:hypothetical protein
MVDTIKGLLEINEVDIQWAVAFWSLLYDVSQSKYLVSAPSSLPESRLFLSQLLINSCLDSSKKNYTGDFAGDGQECDSSRIVTDLEVAFLRNLYNQSFIPVTWDSLFFLDELVMVLDQLFVQ